MKRINVGIFTYDFYPFIGGQGRHVYELYKINETYNKVNLRVFSPSENNLKNHIRIFPETNKSRLKHIGFSLKLAKNINNIINKYKLDLVHLHGGPGGLLLLTDPIVPVIFTAHHTYWQQYKYFLKQRWKIVFYLLERKSYEKSKKIICVSNFTKDIIIDKYSMSSKKVVYITNGIHLKKPQNTISANSINNQILYIGRIDERKGVEFLIKAMIQINKSNPELLLHIVGEGKDKNRLHKLAELHKLNIKFYGYLSEREINHLYTTVDLQVVPSVFEGFGITVLEGMEKRICIVATNVDGIKEIIKNNYNGILVKYGDEKALSDAILNLLSNSSLRHQLVTNAYNHLNEYDWSSIYLRTVHEYENVIYSK
jgi:glycogen(starch) synthase